MMDVNEDRTIEHLNIQQNKERLGKKIIHIKENPQNLVLKIYIKNYHLKIKEWNSLVVDIVVDIAIALKSSYQMVQSQFL